MLDEADWSRLARHLACECTPAEANETRAWIAADDQRRDAAERLRDVWLMSVLSSSTSDSDVAWQRLAARMHVTEGLATVALHESPTAVATSTSPLASSSASRRRISLRGADVVVPRYWALAALVAAAAIVFVVREANDTRTTAPAAVKATAESDREFRTARGQHAVVTLGDGSRVELGTESVLRVKPFRDSARVITLVGQAVFEVVHDTAHTFLVYTKNAITEDLGTRFSVRAYPRDNRVQVLVTAGKVALRAVGAPAGSGTLLSVLDLGVLDSAGQTTVRNGVDTTRFLAWTRERFVFDNAPLSEVLPDIARWFDVEIDVANDQLQQRRVTMNVPASSLRSVLGAATLPLGLHFTVNNRAVVVR